MENELKCALCSQVYKEPILLQCHHSVCYSCVLQSIDSNVSGLDDSVSSTYDSDCTQDLDKLSIISEADSGVVCSSRPLSFISTTSTGNLSVTLESRRSNQFTHIFRCPVCSRPLLIDEREIDHLPRNRVLERIVDKYRDLSPVSRCQLCVTDTKPSTVFCEQCQVYYCDICREKCHPNREPFISHSVVDSLLKKDGLTDSFSAKLSLSRSSLKLKPVEERHCRKHPDEILSLFCDNCRTFLCCFCARDSLHATHNILALGVASKAAKTNLSQNLHSLSERAKTGTEFIQSLKISAEKTQENCETYQTYVASQCDELMEAIERRKLSLLDSLSRECEYKVSVLREQSQHYTNVLQRTTGLLQFCIESLKEPDAIAFLQVAGGLSHRVLNSDKVFNPNVEFHPKTDSSFDFTLDTSGILRAINSLNFFQLKAPGAPSIIVGSCTSINNSVTATWQPHLGSVVEAYTLEMDDGLSGNFRVMYIGREKMCTIDGLHFSSQYRIRVKAHNHCGESSYSSIITLETSKVATFTIDPQWLPQHCLLSSDGLSVTATCSDTRTVLGSVGLSRGCHYWRWRIEAFPSESLISFGVDQRTTKSPELSEGLQNGWMIQFNSSSYCIRHNNSLLQANIVSELVKGDNVGILIDLELLTLSFFINDLPLPTTVCTLPWGTYYPAVNLNNGALVTLESGLHPPLYDDTSLN